MVLCKRTSSPFTNALSPLRMWLALLTVVIFLLRTVTPLQGFSFDLLKESNKASIHLALQIQVLLPFHEHHVTYISQASHLGQGFFTLYRYSASAVSVSECPKVQVPGQRITVPEGKYRLMSNWAPVSLLTNAALRTRKYARIHYVRAGSTWKRNLVLCAWVARKWASTCCVLRSMQADWYGKNSRLWGNLRQPQKRSKDGEHKKSNETVQKPRVPKGRILSKEDEVHGFLYHHVRVRGTL